MRIAILILIIALSGCAKPMTQDQMSGMSDSDLIKAGLSIGSGADSDRAIAKELYRRHPEWHWDHLTKNQICTGMTREEVLVSWGKPSKVNPSSHGVQWVYRKMGVAAYSRTYSFVHFRDGVVSYWSQY